MMKLKYWAPVLFFIGLLLVFLILTYQLIFKTLPENTNTMQVPGLFDMAEIATDEFGIPHIVTNFSRDMYFCMGFAHARDRLWQMDMLRRAATAQLTEIFDSSYLEIDTVVIKFDFISLAESLFVHMPDSIQYMLEAYSNGINAFIHHWQAAPAVEFHLLKYTPDDWHPVHTLAIWRLLGWLNSNIRYELIDLLLAAQIPEIYLEIFNINPEIQVTESTRKYLLDEGYKVLRAIEKLDKLTGFPVASEYSLSRLWIENISKSPHPFLTFSPLSMLTIPNIWYLLQVDLKGTLMRGATIPGIPLMFGGTNSHIAWSYEPVLAHNSYFQFDAFSIEMENSLDFKSKRQFVPLPGQDTLWISTRTKNEKPILSQIQKTNGQYYFLMYNWTGSKFDSLFVNLFQIWGINSIEQIKPNLPTFSTPSIQFLALDQGDKIVFYKSGSSFIPVRNRMMKQSNRIELFALKPSFKSIAAETTQLKFPYLNFTVDSILNLEPVFGRKIWQNFYNATQSMDSADLYKLKFVMNNLTCRFSSSAAQILPLLIKLMDKLPDSIDVKEVCYLLKQWDYHEHGHSYAATIFNLLLDDLTFTIFHDEMGDSLYYFFSRLPELVNHALIKLFQDPGNIWHDIKVTDSLKETLPDLLTSILMRFSSKKNENDSIPNFLWKLRTPFVIEHWLAERKSWDTFLNSEKMHLQGNGFPINLISQVTQSSTFIKGWPLQMIFLPSDSFQVFWTMSTGQSGHILSQDYKNLSPNWLEGQFIKFEIFQKQPIHRKKIILTPLTVIGTN